jgi:fumarate hydratase class II
MSAAPRIESDAFGEIEVPADRKFMRRNKRNNY